MHYEPQARDSHMMFSASPGLLQAFLELTAGVVPRSQRLKLSPQPHVPLMFGLLNTNSLDNLSST